MSALRPITKLAAGMHILVGDRQLLEVSPALAEAFQPGDTIRVLEATGEVLHIPSSERQVAERAVSRAVTAFEQMSSASEAQVTKFYQEFAARLADHAVWSKIKQVNEQDVAAAAAKGRSTTRLIASDTLRESMISGLHTWAQATSQRGRVLERVEHDGWSAELVGAELGVVGFVFEGRPNVVADATGVLRGGNTVVFRIGRDALRTAEAMLEAALVPALEAAGLPSGAVSLVESPSHAAGWAMFGDKRLALAVARGSGPAVAALGALAQGAGVPVSLHGTGGAWLFASQNADAAKFEQAVVNSLDRKVCNTLNTCCIPESRSKDLVAALLTGLQRAGERRKQSFKLHVTAGSETHVPQALFEKEITVRRAEGEVQEKQAESIQEQELGREWEWEDTPEVTLKIVSDLDHGVELFNRYSPQFVACLISSSSEEHDRFYARVNAPFVGDAHTRWVDGQVALRKPELGLSNWQNGRLFGRGGILSGDSVFTVRTRVRQSS